MSGEYMVDAKPLTGEKTRVRCSGEPDECPICHKKIIPKTHGYYFYSDILS